MNKGILIIAQGKQRYIDMAINIAKSLEFSNPHIQRALVTDSVCKDLSNHYDFVIPIDPKKGIGFNQKMHMDEYSPFQCTLFIDVDCLVMKNIDFIFDKMKGCDLNVIGNKIHSGNFIGTTIEELKKHYSFEFLPSFNGGVYYFEKTEKSKQIFDFARNVFFDKYNELGLWLFSGKPGDEPAFSLALGVFGVSPIPDPDKITMYTPVGQKGVFEMDILKGHCKFLKHNEFVYPVIMHFGGGYPEAFHYKREIAKLGFYLKSKLPKQICSFLINLIFNSAYAIYVFCYRIAKSLLRREKFKLYPILPMFPFE